MVTEIYYLITNAKTNSPLRRTIQHKQPQQNLAGQEGLEPPTLGFGDRYSTN